jgi:predicted esterase
MGRIEQAQDRRWPADGDLSMSAHPHDGQPIHTAGPPLGQSPIAVILVHGRGASPANILELASRVGRTDITYLAPAAAGHTWYPKPFLADVALNEPYLSSALSTIGALVARAEAAGIARSRIVLGGFSQGACLSAEFAIRHASRFGAVAVFSGGAIGPPGTTWNRPGSFDGTPVFLGCSDRDSHIPATRVDETAAVFSRMGAEVTKRLYPNMGHLVIDDEIDWLRGRLNSL